LDRTGLPSFKLITFSFLQHELQKKKRGVKKLYKNVVFVLVDYEPMWFKF